MCVIIKIPSGVPMPSEEYLTKCWNRNSHGAGIVAVNGNLPPFFQKGIMKKEEFFEVISKLSIDQDRIIHLRIKSRGDVNPELTHPFPFDDKYGRKRWFFHNGTISQLCPPVGKSDSSFFAELLSVVSDETVDALIKAQSSFGRFVTVTQKNPESLDFNVIVYPDKESKEIDGVWYSNVRHETETKTPAMGDGGDCGYYYTSHDYYHGYNGQKAKSSEPVQQQREMGHQKLIPYLPEDASIAHKKRAIASEWMTRHPTSPLSIAGVIDRFQIDLWSIALIDEAYNDIREGRTPTSLK